MLPLNMDYYKKKRADCHLWPKGTFLQIDDNPIEVVQRRQQSHDHQQWKGICKHLDLVERIPDPNKKIKISLFTYDTDCYAYVVGICKHRSVDTMLSELMKENGPEAITKLSNEDSIKKALTFAGSELLGVDMEDDNTQTVGKFVFCLTCPISKQPMKIPVRGKTCKHFQVRLAPYFKFFLYSFISVHICWSIKVFRPEELHFFKFNCVRKSMALRFVREFCFVERHRVLRTNSYSAEGFRDGRDSGTGSCRVLL